MSKIATTGTNYPSNNIGSASPAMTPIDSVVDGSAYRNANDNSDTFVDFVRADSKTPTPVKNYR